jgi:alkanesulfonate monooxygenase SsuD/methylene tetrahydromethanopterin reductase-like flavin-dependent oxidoreductase (luciferase family)
MAKLDDIDPSIDAPKPSVNVAATGPRTIELAVRWADGVSFSVGADLDRLRHSISLARDACSTAGRDFDSLAIGCYVQVAVTDDDDVSAREAIRGLVITHAVLGLRGAGRKRRRRRGARAYRQAVRRWKRCTLGPRRRVERIAAVRRARSTYPRRRADDHRPIRDRRFREYCAERLREIVDLGITRVYIGTRSVGVDLDERNSDRVGREVLLPRS